MVWFDSILLLFSVTLLHFTSTSYHIHYSLTVGKIRNHNWHPVTEAEEVKIGDLWEMEVDLRSREKEKRTLHFFVRGKQQFGFFKGVPDRVEFGVCYLNTFLFLFHFYFYFVYSYLFRYTHIIRMLVLNLYVSKN